MPDDHRHPSREEQQREEQRQRERKEREREREQREREKHEREAKQRKEREKKEAARSKEQREKREKDEDGKPRTPGQRNVTSSASPPSRHHTREYALPPSRSLPGQQRVSDGNELRDLAVGTLVVALTIFALFVNSARGARAKRTRAINRAHSCPALVELKSTRALDACAEMLAAFDENSNGRVERRPTLQPSLTALTECDRETLSAWATPRQSPRDSPRDSPRQSPRQSRRQMRHVSPRQSARQSPRRSQSPRRHESLSPASIGSSTSPRSFSPQLATSTGGLPPPADATNVFALPPSIGERPQTRPQIRPSPSQERFEILGAMPNSALMPTGGHYRSDSQGMAPAAEPDNLAGGGASAAGAPSADLLLAVETRSRGSSENLDRRGSYGNLTGLYTGSSDSEESQDGGMRRRGDAGSLLSANGWDTRHRGGYSGNRSQASSRHPSVSPSGSVPASRSISRQVTPDEALERPARPHLFVLGDAGVGKSTIIDVLEGFADSRGVDLEVWEGAPSNREALAVAVPLVVWDAVDEGRGPLKEYVHRHLTSATSKCSPPLSHKEREALFSRTIVVCNKSDVAGCPLPEMQALPSGTLFLAGSATRGTNMRELWRRVETCAAPPDCSFNATSYPPMEGIALVERSFSMDEYALQHQAMLANESSSSGSSSSGTNGAARTGQWGSPLMEPNAAQLDAAQHELAAYIRGAEAVEMMAAYGTSVNAH